MIRFLWRATRGYRLRPWKSPYLRWRIETYWGWHAEKITASDFFRFVREQWREMWRMLKWVSRMSRRAEI